MADTYTQIYIRIIFAVNGRQCLIPNEHKEALHQYITRIITNKLQTVIRINSMPVNAHILVGCATNVTFLKRFDLPKNLKCVFDSDDVSET